jgi:hypothetical protein
MEPVKTNESKAVVINQPETASPKVVSVDARKIPGDTCRFGDRD